MIAIGFFMSQPREKSAGFCGAHTSVGFKLCARMEMPYHGIVSGVAMTRMPTATCAHDRRKREREREREMEGGREHEEEKKTLCRPRASHLVIFNVFEDRLEQEWILQYESLVLNGRDAGTAASFTANFHAILRKLKPDREDLEKMIPCRTSIITGTPCFFSPSET